MRSDDRKRDDIPGDKQEDRHQEDRRQEHGQAGRRQSGDRRTYRQAAYRQAVFLFRLIAFCLVLFWYTNRYRRRVYILKFCSGERGGSRPWVHCFDNIWLAGGLGQHVGLAVRQADRQTGDR
jgi:hypothetical protein